MFIKLCVAMMSEAQKNARPSVSNTSVKQNKKYITDSHFNAAATAAAAFFPISCGDNSRRNKVELLLKHGCN